MESSLKVFFKGSFFFSDNEICLIRALQQKGINVRYYIPIESGRLKGALLSIKKQYPITGIFPAKIYEELNIYGDYLDLNKVYVINSVHKSALHPHNILLRIKVIVEYLRFKPDVLHYTAPLSRTWMFLYKLGGRKVMTLHDPFPHSGQYNKINEKLRKTAFKNSDRIVLLSDEFLDKFSDFYKYPRESIIVSKLGVFDYLESLKFVNPQIDSSFILFFGQIFPSIVR